MTGAMRAATQPTASQLSPWSMSLDRGRSWSLWGMIAVASSACRRISDRSPIGCQPGSLNTLASAGVMGVKWYRFMDLDVDLVTLMVCPLRGPVEQLYLFTASNKQYVI